MKKLKKRFRLVRFAFETREGGILYRHMITEGQIPMLEVNQWLMAKAMRKTSTSKEYGKKLVVFLNYLSAHGADLSTATNDHVKKFIQWILFGDMEDLKLLYYETNRVYQTAAYYLTVITEFYKWLDDNYGSNMGFQRKKTSIIQGNHFCMGKFIIMITDTFWMLHYPDRSREKNISNGIQRNRLRNCAVILLL